MAKLDDLAERIDRLVLRHQELKRTTALIAQQLISVTSERDSLRSRLAAARARVDSLLERLPPSEVASAPVDRAASAASLELPTLALHTPPLPESSADQGAQA